jgi:dCTP deaminase
MILSGIKIKQEVELGNITIDPFIPEYVNPNSYNYRIGNKLLKIKNNVIDPKVEAKFEEIELGERGYVLMPKQLYLASTMEKIGSAKYVTSLIGRSSLGRLGLFLQITADLGHLGAIHCWTLELEVVKPLRIYPGMEIGQVSFWKPIGRVKKYDGKYDKYSLPQISKISSELK